jgi:hypothetical protein
VIENQSGPGFVPAVDFSLAGRKAWMPAASAVLTVDKLMPIREIREILTEET